MPEKNSLAELAEQLNNGYVSLVVNGRQVATFATAAFPELEKVQRIVAELAKADSIYDADPVNNNCVNLQLEAFKKCRAIAKE